MKGVVICFYSVMLAMEIMCWVSATSRTFDALHEPGPSQSPQLSQQPFLESKQVEVFSQGTGTHLTTQLSISDAPVKFLAGEMSEEAYYRGGWEKIGSSPPSCKYKCYGCMPCVATQVPATTSRIGVQYTNYEPEGWKCQCGPSFFSP